MHACEVHACKIHAYKMHAYKMHACKMYAYEGFYEDLVRQNTVARLFQRRLGYRHRHIWISVWSHMGFSHRRSVLKATI